MNCSLITKQNKAVEARREERRRKDTIEDTIEDINEDRDRDRIRKRKRKRKRSIHVYDYRSSVSPSQLLPLAVTVPLHAKHRPFHCFSSADTLLILRLILEKMILSVWKLATSSICSLGLRWRVSRQHADWPALSKRDRPGDGRRRQLKKTQEFLSVKRSKQKDNLSQIFAVVENSFPFHRHSSNEESASHYFSRMAIPLSGMSHIQFLCLKRLQPYRFAILSCSISTIFYIPSTQPESDKVASLCPIPGSCPAVNICTYIHIPKYSLLSVWFVLISPVLNNARNLRFHLSVDKNGEFSEI